MKNHSQYFINKGNQRMYISIFGLREMRIREKAKGEYGKIELKKAENIIHLNYYFCLFLLHIKSTIKCAVYPIN